MTLPNCACGKKSFATQQDAETFAASIQRSGEQPLYAYKRECPVWHVTRQTPEEGVNIVAASSMHGSRKVLPKMPTSMYEVDKSQFQHAPSGHVSEQIKQLYREGVRDPQEFADRCDPPITKKHALVTTKRLGLR